MGRFSGAVWVGSLLAVLAAPMAHATPESMGSVHLGVEGGYGWLSADLDLTGRRASTATPGAGAVAGLRLGVGLSRHVSLEVTGDLIPTSVRRARGEALLVAGLAEIVFHALEGPVSLSWSVGAGALALVSGGLGHDADLLVSAGMGARYLVGSRRVALRADVRVWLADGADRAVSFSPVLTAGVDVYLRRSERASARSPAAGLGDPDGDADGTPDGADRCPDRAGAAAMGGCPDSDRDGLADPDDACPQHAGTPAMAGCPDSDGDGVADPHDACPSLPGEPRFSGCGDRDGDGVPDGDDRCPNDSGFAGRAGCPEPPARDLGRLEGVLAGVRFARGSTRLLPGSDRALREVAELLGRWPELSLVVEAHTARGPSRAQARTLSERRAEAVALRLVAMGVAARRLVSVGRGYDAPIASNKSAAGRARNERIELHLGAP
jgi:hypothetical protein